MPFYADRDIMCQVLTELFGRVMVDPQAVQLLRRNGLVLRLVTTNPALALTVDGKSQPAQITCGESPQPADLVLHMEADTLHRVWMSEIRLRDAYFGGRIQVEGSLWRALSLGDLFRRVERLYPQVLTDRGLLAAR